MNSVGTARGAGQDRETGFSDYGSRVGMYGPGRGFARPPSLPRRSPTPTG